MGLDEKEITPKVYDFDDLRRTEWSNQFELLMRNRLILGAVRYGKLGEPNKPKYDRMSAILNRAARYIEDGNQEHLVDVANLAMLEFVEGKHEKQHFSALDEDEQIHVREKE